MPYYGRRCVVSRGERRGGNDNPAVRAVQPVPPFEMRCSAAPGLPDHDFRGYLIGDLTAVGRRDTTTHLRGNKGLYRVRIRSAATDPLT